MTRELLAIAPVSRYFCYDHVKGGDPSKDMFATHACPALCRIIVGQTECKNTLAALRRLSGMQNQPRPALPKECLQKAKGCAIAYEAKIIGDEAASREDARQRVSALEAHEGILLRRIVRVFHWQKFHVNWALRSKPQFG